MSLRPSCIVEVFAPGTSTWTKRKGAKRVKVQLIGGGCSGNGQINATNAAQNTSSLQGGAPGGYSEIDFPADQLGNTETVIVGAGGAALAASSVNNAAGTPGNPGGNSSFGDYIVARGGIAGGVPGRSMYANTNSGTTGNTLNPNAGNVIASTNNPSLFTGSGGGAGQTQTGGVLTPVGAGSDGNPIQVTTPTVGGNLPPGRFNTLLGGLGGTRPGNASRNGQPGVSPGAVSAIGGTGGGAGVSTQDGVAGGDGGDGGFPGGGGGAAGFGVGVGVSSGKSGKGGDGIVIVTTYF